MSGGSYEYAFEDIKRLSKKIEINGSCYCAHPCLRRAFKKHLELVARACQAIEWNDSCDGDKKETELIKEILPFSLLVKYAIESVETELGRFRETLQFVQDHGGERDA